MSCKRLLALGASTIAVCFAVSAHAEPTKAGITVVPVEATAAVGSTPAIASDGVSVGGAAEIQLSQASLDAASAAQDAEPPTPPGPAAAPKPGPAGALSRALLGDALERHKISLFGWAEASAIASTNDSSDVSPAAFFNTRDGVNLNQLAVSLCSGRACPPFSFGPGGALHNRVGPFPGPKPEKASIDFNVTAMYGRDVQFLKLSGLDGDFRFDRNDSHKLAITQAFLDIYLPLFEGTSVLVGSFQTPLENDIGYAFNPPNWFATHTYAFQHGPAKHVGVLAQSRLSNSSAGIFAIDYGVTLGWNNWDNRNDSVHAIGAIRWRSADMRTWVDLEAMYGNGENDFGPAPGRGGSPYFALSSTGDFLGRLSTFLTVSHAFHPKFQMALEASYGSQQAGDVKFMPLAITSTARWYGANLGARYSLSPKLALNGRAEWFRDEQGAHALWGGNGGSVYAATGNAELQLTPAVRLRGEARYDTFEGPGRLFDRFRKRDQLTGLANLFILF